MILNMQLLMAMVPIQEPTGLTLTGTHNNKEFMEETTEVGIPSTTAVMLLSIWPSVSQPRGKGLPSPADIAEDAR
jgi:hypothetical protein